MVITVVTVVAASVIITIFGERNFFWAGAGLQPAQYESASEEATTLFSDCISSFKNQNAPMSDFFQAPIPWSHDDR